MELKPVYGQSNLIHTAFVAGVAQVEEHLITLLNPETLIRHTDEVALMVWEAKLNGLEPDASQTHEIMSENGADPTDDQSLSTPNPLTRTHFFDFYCPDATAEERQIMHQRAVALRQPPESSNINELIPLAVVGLEEEYYGLALENVREFINVRNVTPIPCCPAHILGNINLRGEVMTLVDIREPLNLCQSENHVAKAIVIEVDDVVAGITVDEVIDVMYLPRSDLASMPTALPQRCQDFFQGTTLYHQKTLSILDLPTILSEGGLIVNHAA